MNLPHVFAKPSAGLPNNLPGPTEALVRWLIQHAARNAPAALSERLEEEWLADLAVRSGPMARLRFGVGCCWATRVIAYEHSASEVLATASKAGNQAMAAYAQHHYSLFSRRTTTFLVIAGLHVVVIYGLATGMGRSIIQVIPTRMQFVPLQDPQTRQEPPPELPQPQFTTTRIKIPSPELTFDVPPDASGLQDVTVRIDENLLPPPPPKTVSRVPGGPGRGFPNTEDYYPAGAKRMGLRGVATVSVCVDDSGRLTAAPTLAGSSGSASLDDGALKLAKAGSGHYRAATEDGRAVNSCYEFRIKFDLKD